MDPSSLRIKTALSDEYTSFVKQLKFMGTRHESKIDDMYKPAMLDLHALLQLSVDLEAEHQGTVMLHPRIHQSTSLLTTLGSMMSHHTRC